MMDTAMNMESVAEQVGGQGVEKLITEAEKICTYEQQRIALANEPDIVRLQAECAILLAEERRITNRLALAPPPADSRRIRLKRIASWAIAAVLAVTGLFSTMLSLAPFRLGWMSWLIAAGMSVLTPFLVDQMLEHPGMQKMLIGLTAIAAAVSLSSLMLLALIRGDILAEQMRASEAQAAVIDDGASQPDTPSAFYDHATGMLSAALFLLAFATELGGGLVLHTAWRSMPDDSENWSALRHELFRIRGRIAQIAGHVTTLRNAPELFGAQYWRDFYRALILNATRSAMTKLLAVILAFIAFGVQNGHAQDRLNLVVAIDLTRSVQARGPDGQSDFQKDVLGVSRLLSRIPAGTQLAVIGITGHSFTEPYILLKAHVPDDAGYFGEKLSAARSQIVHAWNQKATHLSPDSKQTDIFGVLQLASQIFAERADSSRKELVIFSDMRESTPEMDFGGMGSVPDFPLLERKCAALPALAGAQVYAVGVDGAGKSPAYWASLHQFWSGYLQNTGAKLQAFSLLTDAPPNP